MGSFFPTVAHQLSHTQIPRDTQTCVRNMPEHAHRETQVHTQSPRDTYMNTHTDEHTPRAIRTHTHTHRVRHMQTHTDSETQGHIGTQKHTFTPSQEHMYRQSRTHTSPSGVLKETRNRDALTSAQMQPPHRATGL